MWFFIFQSVALLSVACGFGVFAGWLFWGGDAVSAPSPLATTSISDGPGMQLSSGVTGELVARTADVARLRQKLKRAVVELDRRAELLVAARDEHETLQLHLDALASQLVSGGAVVSGEPAAADPSLVEAASASVEPASVEPASAEPPSASVEPTMASAEPAMASAEPPLVEPVSAEEFAALQSEILAVERLVTEAESRASEANARAEAAEAEVAALRTSLASLERESEGRLAALELDLTSARLRTRAASKELSDFSTELKSLRDANATFVETTQTTMQDLQTRLDGAASALNGRSGHGPAPEAPISQASLYELVSLPGMTHELSAQLRDIGVQSVTDIAGWTPDDVERFQAWLPDHPGVIARNAWVDVAKSLVAEAEVHPEKGGGADEESTARGVFFDARAHSEIAG